METTTQFQSANNSNANQSTNKLEPSVVRKAQTLVSTNQLNSISSVSNVVGKTAQSNVAGVAGGGELTKVTVANSSTNVTNLITTNTAVVSNGQATPQQIIQVSSQAGAIMPGQQLMVQTLSGRPQIQLRPGQQFQQIQLIPFGNLQAQNQRPVIIQQTPANVQLHHSPATTIASIANLTHNNVSKITSVGHSAVAHQKSHQKPVIIQQATGQFIHSTNAQSHGLHSNLPKIATVGRAPARSITQQTKMVLGHLTTATPNHQSTAIATSGSSNHHTGAVLTNQSNHLTNSTMNVTGATLATNPQQVTRLNIISSLPSGVHHTNAGVSNVQQHNAGKPILSLATATLNKPLIINPATSVVQPQIVGNVVNMSNFNATPHQLKQANTTTTIIPTMMTLTTLTTSTGPLAGRHTITSNCSAQQFNQTNSSLATSNNGGQLIINSSNQTNQAQHSSNQTINSSQPQTTAPQSNQSQQQLSSTIRSSNTLNSPIKQQLPQNTPSSPRPSILIRKRVGTPLDLDSKMNYQSGAATSINSNSANAKNSQLNLVKQNLTMKYQNCSSITSSASKSVKSAQELLNSTSSPSPISSVKPQSANTATNSTAKKIDSSNTSGQLAQSIKCENEVMNNDLNQLVNNALSNTAHNAANLTNSNTNNSADNRHQITPRKRRKQLLEPFMLTTSQNIKLLNDESNNLLCNEELRKKDGPIGSINYQSNILCRPRPSLLSSYNLSWKSLQYHFLRHAEVKIKNEKKVSLQELTNETVKRRNGWKVNHLSAQLEDILECEISFNRKLKEMSKVYSDNKDSLPPQVKELGNRPFNVKVCHNSITVLDKLNDLFAANIQRSNLIHDQIKDTNNILNKLSNDHREKVNKMSKKFLSSKRSASVKV